MNPRPGFALIYALFMVTALSLIGLGMMATGTTEAMIGAAMTQRAEARSQAEAAALDFVAGWSTQAYVDMPLGSVREDPDGTVSVIRLDSGSFLIRAEARHAGGHARGATGLAGLLVRVLPATSLAATFPAALAADGPVEVRGGEIHGTDSCEMPTAGIQAPEVTVDAAALVAGEPAVRQDPLAPPRSPDPFAPPLVTSLATTTATAPTVSPRPVADAGECVSDDRNWGAIDPEHPCYALLPFVHASGSIRLLGGEAHGVLVADGDVRLSGDLRFRGVLVVGGRLLIEDGAVVEGAIRAASATVAGGEIRRDGCALRHVLQAPALDRAFRPPDRWWVPVF